MKTKHHSQLVLQKKITWKQFMIPNLTVNEIRRRIQPKFQIQIGNNS
jgi:hypothetical protein